MTFFQMAARRQVAHPARACPPFTMHGECWESPRPQSYQRCVRHLILFTHCSTTNRSLTPDKFGRPVYIELVGRTDADRLARAITAERLVRYHVWTWERCVRRYLPACSAAAGRPIITTTNIIDCKGLHMAQLNRVVYKVLRLFSKIDQVRGAACMARSVAHPVQMPACCGALRGMACCVSVHESVLKHGFEDEGQGKVASKGRCGCGSRDRAGREGEGMGVRGIGTRAGSDISWVPRVRVKREATVRRQGARGEYSVLCSVLSGVQCAVCCAAE